MDWSFFALAYTHITCCKMEITRFEKKALFWSLVAGISGIFLSFLLKDGTWFARSGALITAVAVWFASIDLPARLLLAAPDALAKPLAEQKADLLARKEEFKFTEQQIQQIFDQIERDSRAILDKANRALSQRFHYVELYLFLIGTLIWGFGDLPFRLLG